MQITDLWKYAAAVLAVLTFGLSKGGFGGGLGLVAVPLIISPIHAAVTMLPILFVMDVSVLYRYRGRLRVSALRTLLPAAVIGIGAGSALFGYLNVSIARLVVGVRAVAITYRCCPIICRLWAGWARQQPDSHALSPTLAVGGQ